MFRRAVPNDTAITGQDISQKRLFPVTCRFCAGKTELKMVSDGNEQNQLYKFVKNTIMAIVKCYHTI